MGAPKACWNSNSGPLRQVGLKFRAVILLNSYISEFKARAAELLWMTVTPPPLFTDVY